jgi:hypothetical protein
MARPNPAPPSPPRRRLAAPLALGGASLVVAFLVGRFTAETEPAVTTPAPAAAKQQPSDPWAAAPMQAVPAPPVAAPAPAAAASPAPAPVPAQPVVLTPEIANRVNREAKVKLEALREQVVATCWPSGGAAKGLKRASVTYNLTFDAQGREIARGIAEDRRAPAGEFGKCLRQLERNPITVSPPGTNVGLSVAMSYP